MRRSSSAGLETNTRGVVTPGVKGENGDRVLAQEKASAHRLVLMRAAYLALDRPELLYSVKEIARGMSAPTEGDRAKLRRLARYLGHCPRVWQRFMWQRLPSVFDIECGSDFAGCSKTRKSTSGYAAMLGEHCISSRSKTQSVIATSTGEAEFYAICSAVSQGLGLKTLLDDLNVKVKVRIGADAYGVEARTWQVEAHRRPVRLGAGDCC